MRAAPTKLNFVQIIEFVIKSLISPLMRRLVETNKSPVPRPAQGDIQAGAGGQNILSPGAPNPSNINDMGHFAANHVPRPGHMARPADHPASHRYCK